MLAQVELLVKLSLALLAFLQKRKDPDPDEAFQYYTATFDYTEKLRNVLIELRKRLV